MTDLIQIEKLSELTPKQFEDSLDAMLDILRDSRINKAAAAVFKKKKSKIDSTLKEFNERVDDFLYKSCGTEQGCAELYDRETDTKLILVQKYRKAYDDDDLLSSLLSERDNIADSIAFRKGELEEEDKFTEQAMRPYYQAKR